MNTLSNGLQSFPIGYFPLAILAFFCLYVSFSRNRICNLPPSPGRAIPFLGHLHIMPTKNGWLTLSQWSKEIGPLFHLNVVGQHVVVLGSHKVASDLLDRRSAIYSERPRNVVAGELLTGGMVFAFVSHNAIFKRMRRAAQEAFANVKRYTHMQETEAYILCHQLLQTPADWDDHLRRASSSLMHGIIYGLPPTLNSLDPNIRRANGFVEKALAAAAPGAFLVEYLPWMMHLPRWMCSWRRYAEGIFARDSVLFEELFSDVVDRVRKGTQVPSAASSFYENKEKLGMTDREAAWCATTLYTAGGETTSSQMSWVLMSFVLYPEVQKKAQEEVDRVVGRDRMPTFQDLEPEQMPYLHALVREILRWRGVGPLGVPHRLNQDDHYEGYFLPKDTIVVPNAWAINHDVNVWGNDAEDFRPERHLDEDGRLKRALADTHDESHVTFGYGRRICVGRHIASNSLRIYTACILWSFNLKPSIDDKGNLILPDPNAYIDEGLTFRPQPFWFIPELRKENVVTGIAQTLEARDQSV
ncbi:cytochrome P450 [Marasmius fiardii PR-910]|nr:cytochrome P450 [Marasmius fiardii PR-910]